MPVDRDATLKRAEKLLRQGKLDAAIAEYVRLTSAHPSDWNSVNTLGDLYLRAGDAERAIMQFARAADHFVRDGALAKAAAVYKKILRISPGDVRGTRGLALVDEKQAAAQPVKRDVRLAPGDPDARMLAARQAQDAADVPRACALFIEAADLYAAQGRPADAIAAVAEASSIDPANEEYRRRILQMLIAAGELTQARYVARTVSELVMVADALEAAGRHADAVEAIGDAALVDPDDARLRERVLRQLVAGGELDRARRLAQTPADWKIVAAALTEDNRGSEAADVVEQAVEEEPTNLELRAPLVAACLAAGDVERAREAARTAGDWMLLAEAMRADGREQEALAAMHEATQRDPHDADLHDAFVRACLAAGDLRQARDEARTKAEIVAVAAALEAQGDRDAARQMRADALRRDPDDPELRLRLIQDYVAAGDTARAHPLLTLDVAGDDAELLVLLARLEFGIGRLDEGRRALQRLLTLRPGREEDIRSLGRDLLNDEQADAAFACVEAAADAAIAAGDPQGAVEELDWFIARAPHHVAALLKLIEVCVDAGLHEWMCATQERLADAYLQAGRGAEARLIAEDLVLRAPWDRGSVQRLMRALVLCGEPEPEETIANLLCGDGSFTLEAL